MEVPEAVRLLGVEVARRIFLELLEQHSVGCKTPEQ
jgi:hypothetical protein